MRRILELVTVFLLGAVLTFYIVESKNNHPAPADNLITKLEPAELATPAPRSQSISKPASVAPSAVPDGHLASAQHYLAQGHIELFLQSLDKHRADGGGQGLQDYRETFLQALQQLKNNKQFRTAIDWLTAYLQSEYDDVVALQALADFHYLQKNYLAAIDTLYKAKSYAHETDKIAQISASQRAIISEYAAQLQNRNDNLGLLDLYQRLVSEEPEYGDNYIGLAQAYLALGNDADAHRSLNIIAYDPEASAKAQQLLTVIENRANKAATDAEPIQLQRHGNNLLTEVSFNNSPSGRLLLDTGASLTVITPQLLQNLGLDYNHPQRKAWFNTANGVVEAPIFIIDRVSVGSQIVDELEVAVMDLDSQNISGLLGMNFLQHFRFSIDQHNNVLYLSPRI